jgi:hypothetical protein
VTTSALRLSLGRATGAEAGSPDGAWWPWTDDLSTELPTLLAELDGGPARVVRVAYNQSGWASGPAHVGHGRRKVRVAWFRGMDPTRVSMGLSDRTRLDLLVVPATTSAKDAEQAMAGFSNSFTAPPA